MRKHKSRQLFVRPSGVTNGDINVTPLVDVVLVLLIIFMVVTPMLQRGKDVVLPKSKVVDKEDQEAPSLAPIVLEIDASGAMFLNKTYVTAPQLPGMLTQVYADRADKLLFIKALKGVTYGDVLSVMDVAKGAGVEVLGAMLPTAEEWAQARPGGF